MPVTWSAPQIEGRGARHAPRQHARSAAVVEHVGCEQCRDQDGEWAYDRQSEIGRLDKGLDEAKDNGWMVVSMKGGWKIIPPFEKR